MTLKEIISEVYGVDMTKRTRDRRFVEARQAFCFFCREYTKMGVVEIGNEIGMKHSNVSYGTRHYYDILHYADVKAKHDEILFRMERQKRGKNCGVEWMCKQAETIYLSDKTE